MVEIISLVVQELLQLDFSHHMYPLLVLRWIPAAEQVIITGLRIALAIGFAPTLSASIAVFIRPRLHGASYLGVSEDIAEEMVHRGQGCTYDSHVRFKSCPYPHCVRFPSEVVRVIINMDSLNETHHGTYAQATRHVSSIA